MDTPKIRGQDFIEIAKGNLDALKAVISVVNTTPEQPTSGADPSKAAETVYREPSPYVDKVP
jgi:hypothetical protein